ncbi:MAG: DUF2232 domain-containing protein, partial [Bdellovibrionales bacterium]|nr:DUF2232 domain-containing protein [Bdellovibrionales bacterium]
TFGQFKSVEEYHWIASNVFNTCFFLYFLQGLSVTATLLKRLRMAAFWQVFLVVFIGVQLFVFVGLIGIVDYWADFRRKMKSEPAGLNKTYYKKNK